MAERPLSVQSTDLRWDAGQRARRTESGSSASPSIAKRPRWAFRTSCFPADAGGAAGCPEREWRLHRNAALTDAAAHGAGLDGAPQHLVASREGAAVRHRQPQTQEQPVVAVVVVLEGGAGVVYNVVVDELDVARREAHLETQLLGKFGEEIERLPLPVADPRHLAFRLALRRFDIGARIMAGELAVAPPPHGKRVGRLVGRVLLAEAAAPEVLVERRAQIGAAFEHHVVHCRR